MLWPHGLVVPLPAGGGGCFVRGLDDALLVLLRMKGLAYLIGPSLGWQTAYKVAFCVFIIIGASIKLDAVLDFSDAMVFVLCVPNVLGLLILAPVVVEELKKLHNHAA